MITTLNQIREHSPCGVRPNPDGSLSGLRKLMKFLGKETTDDEPVSIIQVLDSNGLDDAIWTLRAVTGRDKEIRLFAVWCARQVEHLNTDPRVKQCNDVAERFANGEATQKELDAAREAAWEAEWAAAGAAREAEWAAALEAAEAAGAARNAAGAAAGAAAGSAAGSAAGLVVGVVGVAAGVVGAAAGAAAGAAGAAQEKELRRICAKCDGEK